MKALSMAVAIAGLFIAGSLLAQNGVKANVPFSFHVGNSQVMPPGTYLITPCSQSAMQVHNCKEGVTVFHSTQPFDKEISEKGKLVFHKYGKTYFLSEVHGPSLSTGFVLPVSKSEKKLRDDTATVRTVETITIPREEEDTPPKQ